MASQAPDPTASAQARRESETERSNRYQVEFDVLIAGLVALGLLLTIFYGAFAQTCPPDPAHVLAPAAAPQSPVAGAATAARAAPALADPAANRATTAPSNRPPAGVRCNASGASRFVGALLALAIALAALAVGCVVGFLFGLPRTLTSSEVREARARQRAEGDAQSGDSPAEQSAASAASAKSEVNTNLEKISDWLTTIIVGVGLTQLEEIPGALDDFGDRVAIYFGFGGKVFGIGGGLFFLIAGFFLAYVGTRVKLSLIFTRSQVDNRRVESNSREVAVSKEAPIVQTAADAAAGGLAVSEQLQQADEVLLTKSLNELKTNDQVLAWANAKARAGDYQSALTAYKDVLKRVPLTEKISRDYAIILAATGNQAAAQNVVGALSATANLGAEAARDLGQQVTTASLQARLQGGLYRWPERGFEDSIIAGEHLVKLDDQAKVAMNHVWLACAYGQKHRWLQINQPESAARTQALAELEDNVVAHVEAALAIEHGLKTLLASLYDPSRQVGNDNDLQSLFGSERLDGLLLSPETPPAEERPRA
jgi:hypothetical protein